MIHSSNKRVLALDLMRGITVAGMILVNNPGTWRSIFPPLEHASWHGLTPTDLVFPFFMFIMGVSTYMSLSKYDFKCSKASVLKILRRSVVILLVGWTIAWFALFLRGLRDPEMSFADAVFNFSRIRALGVLPRLAICYCVTALLAVNFSRRTLLWITGLLLGGYTVLLLAGNGFALSDTNVLAVVDRNVLGETHMYTDTIDGVTLKFDPEGLLSTLPSIAHCLIGFLCGALIKKAPSQLMQSNNLLVVGAVLAMCGGLLSYGIPINKKIWSPTFVFTTCGMAAMLLGLLIWVTDIKGYVRWGTFFKVFGVNPLFLYAFATLLSLLFSYVHFGDSTVHSFLYKDLFVTLCGTHTKLASLCFAVTFVLINGAVGYVLYRKKIYIKI